MIKKSLTILAGENIQSRGLIAEIVGNSDGFSIPRLTLTKPVVIDAIYIPEPLTFEGEFSDLYGTAHFLGYHPNDVAAGRLTHHVDALTMAWRASEVLTREEVSAPAGATMQDILGPLAPLVYLHALSPDQPLEGGEIVVAALL